MSANSKIEWTDTTWNPVSGCTKVSDGCDHCYAERITERFHGKGAFANVELHPERLYLPLRWRKPRRVFVDSMSDLFHKDVSDEFIARVWAIMAATPQHVYQILTKRHGRLGLLSSPRWASLVLDAVRALPDQARGPLPNYDAALRWAESPELVTDLPPPLPNVHLGVSVEDQKHADLRIPALLDTPAAVRFLSCEPLLGPIDLAPWIDRLDWVIAGGESGPGARPMHPDWVRQLRDQCVGAKSVPGGEQAHGVVGPLPLYPDQERADLLKEVQDVDLPGYVPGPDGIADHQCVSAGVPFHFKQWGGRTPKAGGRELDGRTWDEFPAAVS